MKSSNFIILDDKMQVFTSDVLIHLDECVALCLDKGFIFFCFIPSCISSFKS